MSADFQLSRRGFAGGLALLALGRKAAFAQGFAGLGSEAGGFASVVPGRTLSFPVDHGPHPDYRIEWWYVTANLTDSSGAAWARNGRCFGRRWRRARNWRAGLTSRSGWGTPL